MSGNSYVGGVCGYNKGGIVIGCHNSGRVTSNSSSTDGVCGKNEGTLENSSNNGEVSGSSDFGDVCGKNNRTVSNCYYLSATSGTDSNDPNAKTKEQFASGEVAYLLQKALDDAATAAQVWGQRIGTDTPPCAWQRCQLQGLPHEVRFPLQGLFQYGK